MADKSGGFKKDKPANPPIVKPKKDDGKKGRSGFYKTGDAGTKDVKKGSK